MDLRGRLPKHVSEPLRRGYLQFGAATAGMRLLPDFIVVGASRSGTTSLFRALNAHPQIVRPPVNKGVRFFDLNYARGMRWYRGHFPVRAVAGRRTPDPRTYEASGYYLFHPLAVPRIAEHLPRVRLVAMLRDPAERAYSGWKHESARGFETESFERALALEDERLVGEPERLAMDPGYRSFAMRHLSHRSRGEYADQLERVLAHFPREQIHIVVSEEFFAEPEREYAALRSFLGLPPFQPGSFDRHNARPSSPMPPAVEEQLRAHYQPYNRRLEELLGRPLPWS